MSGNSPSYHRDLPTVRGKVHPTLLATSKGLLAPAEASAAWPRAVPVHTVGRRGWAGQCAGRQAHGGIMKLFLRPQEISACWDSSSWDKHLGDIGGLLTILSCPCT